MILIQLLVSRSVVTDFFISIFNAIGQLSFQHRHVLYCFSFSSSMGIQSRWQGFTLFRQCFFVVFMYFKTRLRFFKFTLEDWTRWKVQVDASNRWKNELMILSWKASKLNRSASRNISSKTAPTSGVTRIAVSWAWASHWKLDAYKY